MYFIFHSGAIFAPRKFIPKTPLLVVNEGFDHVKLTVKTLLTDSALPALPGAALLSFSLTISSC